MAAIRYLVHDVDAAVAFYTRRLGFSLREQFGPNMAILDRAELTLWVAGPGASAAKPMPDGRKPEPGGWNRLMLVTEDIDGLIRRLSDAGASFRGEMSEAGAGRARLLEDPSGNLVELFEFKQS